MAPKTQAKPAVTKVASPATTKEKKCCSHGCGFDLFFVIAYLAWFAIVVIVVFMTRCEHILPPKIGTFDISAPICGAVDKIEHLFGHALDAYKSWGEKIFNAELDFSLVLVHRVNVLLAPGALVLAFGFLKGRQWAKNFGQVHATVMLYNMVVIDMVACKVLHSLPQGHVVAGFSACTVASIIYGFWTFFPIAVLARLWSDKPFEAQSKSGCCLCSCVWKLLCVVWGIAALIAFYEFGVKNVDTWKSLPSVADHSSNLWEQTSPHRESFLLATKDARDAVTGYATNVGESVVQFVKNLNKGE